MQIVSQIGTDPDRRLGPIRRSVAWRSVIMALSIAVYFAAAPTGYLYFVIVYRLSFIPEHTRIRHMQRIVCRAFAWMHDWLRFVGCLDFDRRGIRGRVSDEPCVIVSNHPSWSDISVLMAAVGPACTAIKSELYSRRWARPLLAGSGHFEVSYTQALGAERLLDAGVARLRDGFRVLVFPEGTRSPVGGLGPFFRSPFELACRAGVDIVPIEIRMEPPWLGKGSSLIRPPAIPPRVRLEVLPRISPAEYGNDSRSLMAAVEAMYRTRLSSAREATATR